MRVTSPRFFFLAVAILLCNTPRPTSSGPCVFLSISISISLCDTLSISLYQSLSLSVTLSLSLCINFYLSVPISTFSLSLCISFSMTLSISMSLPLYAILYLVQFLGLYSSQCTHIVLLMLSMTTNFFIMHMLTTPNCIPLLLLIKLIHYLLHQPMISTYGCQQTNLK